MIEWRRIADWPDYEVSECGDVRRLDSQKVRQPNCRPNGYLQICFKIRGKVKAVKVHRLVAYAFLGEPPSPLHEVAHHDGTKTNNHYSNLRWATRKENHADKHRHGTAAIGEKNPMAKLVDAEIVEIKSLELEGWPQLRIAKHIGISQSHVHRILRGKRRASMPQNQA